MPRTKKVIIENNTNEEEPVLAKVTSTNGKKWMEVFLDNYNETSELALSLKNSVKSTYKDDPYIPWAVMERCTYMLDEDASFDIVKDDKKRIVHTDQQEIYQMSTQNTNIVESRAYALSHFVVVGLTFMGKYFEDTYAIQDAAYNAVRVYDQNLVNKALQRAKARVASKATGLGWKLYERLDLQFEDAPGNKISKVETNNLVKDKKEEIKPIEVTTLPTQTVTKEVVETPTVVTPTVVVEPTVIEEPKVFDAEEEFVDGSDTTTEQVATIEYDNVTKEAIALIKSGDTNGKTGEALALASANAAKINSLFQKLNPFLIKSQGISLSITDTPDKIASNLTKLKSVETFVKSLKNALQ